MSGNWQDTLKEGRYGDLVGLLHLPEVASLQVEERWAVRMKQVDRGDRSAIVEVLTRHLCDSRDWEDKNVDEIIALIQDRYPDLDTSDIPESEGHGYFGHESLRDAIEDLLAMDDEDEEEEEEDEEDLSMLSDDDRQTIELLRSLKLYGDVDFEGQMKREEEEERESARLRAEGYISFSLALRKTLTDADVKAVEYLLAYKVEVAGKVLDALAVEESGRVEDWFEFHGSDPRFYDILPKSPGGEDMRGRVNCDGISLIEHPDGEMSYTQFSFHRIWMTSMS